MKTMTLIGIILIVVGAVGLIYGGITYATNRNIVDMGPMHVEVRENRQIPVPPIAGAAALATGIVLMVVGRRRHVGSGAV
jgi:hypothetical protein